MEQEESSKSAPLRSELFSFFLHQDNLMWNRLQTLGVVQIGALSSAYGLRTTRWLSLCTLVLGFFLTLLIFFLLKRDELIRMKIEKQHDQLEYSVPRVWYAPIKGREATWIIVGGLLAADVILGVAVVCRLIP